MYISKEALRPFSLSLLDTCNWFLACLCQTKSQAIVIARSSSQSLSLSHKNFNVAHYSKSVEDINTKLGLFVHHDKMQLQDKGHNFESHSFGVMSLFNLIFKLNDGPLHTSIGAACNALVLLGCNREYNLFFYWTKLRHSCYSNILFV